MNDKQLALDAFTSAQKDRMAKAYSTYVEAFVASEGQGGADALRQQATQRLKAGLNILKAAHEAAQGVVGEVFP